MSDSASSTRTITHQGKDLRLSLPLNDYRADNGRAVSKNELQSLDIEAELAALTQTVEIFPDNANDKDMRVVCSVADRAQWDQKLRQIKERKLQEMGVGSVSNIMYNAPQPMLVVKPRRDSINAHTFWTGLHTPAVSTGSVMGMPLMGNQQIAQPAAKPAADPLSVESLAAKIANLQARHHQVSKSVSQIIASGGATHGRSLSQRDIIHKRLSSIAPMVVRNPSRVVSTIESIPEESEDKSYSSEAHEATDAVPVEPIATNPFSLHQHLLSNDMSELIRPQPTHYMPNFDMHYESFKWADEPLDMPVTMISQDFGQSNALLPAFDYSQSASFDGSQLQPAYMNHPEEYYFYPQVYPENEVMMSGPIVQEIPAVRDYQNHGASRSSFNTNAEEFIPFSQAVVRPRPESQAIPIIRPPEALSDEDDSDSGVEIDATFDKAFEEPSQTEPSSDAYNGFDSGSEDSLDEGESASLNDSHIVDYQSPINDNDERVRSFKFPSPEKNSAITPNRPRSNLLNSASPEERVPRLLSTNLPPPKMASTPRKSPKIFQKSVEMGDEELDSIIMNLSIRERGEADAQDESESEDEMEETSQDLLQEDTAPNKRPGLSRVPSAKLLLSHQDADMGLLLDAMLSAKLASVTESMAGLQTTIRTIEQKLDDLTVSVKPEQTQSMLESLARQLAELQASKVFPTQDQDYRELEEKIRALEQSRAEDDSVASLLRQELWNATSELERLRSLLPSQDEQQATSPNEVQEQSQDVSMLQKTVGELTTKASQLEGRLHESKTFCSALQSQYSASELSLARLRKELNEVQSERDQAVQACSAVRDRYELLKEHMNNAAEGIAAEQSRWVESDQAKDAKIAELTALLETNGTTTSKEDLPPSRRSSAVSVSLDTRMTQYLMDRVKSLELANQHLQTTHRQELQARESRHDDLLRDWRAMSSQTVTAEATIDGLRAELVMSTEFGDRVVEDLRRSHGIIESLTAQLRKAGPASILKRSRSDMNLGAESASEQIILKLVSALNEKDNKISQLESMLKTPADSTERQLLTAVNDSIVPVPANACQMEEVGASLKERVKELKRMRMSWEAKAPVLIAAGRAL